MGLRAMPAQGGWERMRACVQLVKMGGASTFAGAEGACSVHRVCRQRRSSGSTQV